tara:strand:+ start:178 stop:1863 length:1686 start_codon:yes stop_codon:yes gene_type:complete
MNFSFYNYIFFYFIILFSVIGYGLFFAKITQRTNIQKNFGYAGLLGLFFLTIYSYISHFIIAHSLLHNSILVILGIFFFIFYIFRDPNNKKEIYFTLCIFLILFISALIFKTHDDFPYYHFAYSYHLTQSSVLIGIGPFSHGFRTPSSIFYLNSLFYLPSISFYMFHMPALLVMGFSNIIIIKKILNNFRKNQINFITYFSLFSVIFINIFFYRISEHGTDRSAQILVFLLLIEVILFINFIPNIKKQITKIYLLISLIISFKAFYILYLLFFLPILNKFHKEKKIKDIFKLFKNSYFIYSSLLILLVLITSFLSTGCFLFPVVSTCFQNLPWSADIEVVIHMNNWYEQWSKAGAAPNFRITNIDPLVYIAKFNWVSNWVDLYFFNKVSDLLLGILATVFVSFCFFYSKTKNNFYKNKEINMIYFVLIMLFFEWFYNHPALRYGGYCLLACVIFIPASIFMEKYSIQQKQLFKKFLILIVITFTVFTGRNISRLSKEINLYSYKPLKETYYRITDHHFRIDKEMNKLIDNYELCKIKGKKCDKSLKPIIIKIAGIYIFTQN